MEIINPHRFAPPAVDFDGFGNASRYFDGVDDYVDLGDSDDFSYGDGVNDSPFSVSAWIKMEDHLKFRIIGKYKDQLPYEKEWVFSSDSTGRLMLFLSDNSTGAYINRRYSDTTTFASYVGQWIHVVGTYDGSGTDSGIKLYINGSRVDDFSLSSGSYTAMENTNQSCEIGSITMFSGRDYTQGHIADCRLYNSELSSTDIAALYGGENITTNLVGHWLKDTPSLLDHSGTNDGTNNGSAFAYDNPSPAVEFGKASRYFDGNDHIDTNASFNTTFQSAFSFACWVRFTDGTPLATNSIFGNQENAPQSRWLFLLGADGKIQSNYHSNDNRSFAKINSAFSNGDTGWMHIACVITPSGQTLYLNGSQATLDPTQTGDMSGVTMGDYDSTIKCFIGARSFNNSPSLYLDGNIADVRIYDTNLTSTDIASIYNGTHIETNLVGHWLTNTDDVKDYAGVNDGTNVGSTYSFDNPLSEGEFGSASRSFDGVNDYIDLGDSDDFSFTNGSNDLPCSISLWFKSDLAVGTSQRLITKFNSSGSQKEWYLNIPSSGKIQIVFQEYNSGDAIYAEGGTAYTQSTWHHVIVTYDGSGIETGIKIYLDGVDDTATQAETGTYTGMTNTSEVVRIGARGFGTGTAAEFNGTIADVRIYDTALGAQDIFDLSRGYDYRTNLIGQWLTNKDDVDDYAGTNHGTNNGSTYSQDAPL